MRLAELFDQPETPVGDRLRQTVMDIITPFMARDVPFITIQAVVDAIRQTRPGIYIDKGLIMTLLDPNEVPAISKIDGDRIYLTNPNASEQPEDSQDVAKNNIQKVKDNAIKQAKSQVKN